MSGEQLKAMLISILSKGSLRVSRRGPAAKDFATWVYGAVEGDFILNLSINRWSTRPDIWSPPAFDPDEAALAIADMLLPE